MCIICSMQTTWFIHSFSAHLRGHRARSGGSFSFPAVSVSLSLSLSLSLSIYIYIYIYTYIVYTIFINFIIYIYIYGRVERSLLPEVRSQSASHTNESVSFFGCLVTYGLRCTVLCSFVVCKCYVMCMCVVVMFILCCNKQQRWKMRAWLNVRKVMCKFPQTSRMTQSWGGATGLFIKTSERFTRRCFDVWP